MYYAETWINYRLYFKSTPDGEWREFSIDMYTRRVIERENEILSLHADIENLKV